MAHGAFWSSSRAEDFWIALAFLAAGALLFRLAPRRGGELMTAMAAIAVTASAFLFICLMIAL